METQFRLYNSINSNFFNLIHGNYETQQTKGLGLLMAKSEIALEAFLEIKAFKDESTPKTHKTKKSSFGDIFTLFN